MGQVTEPIQREARVQLALGAGVEVFCGVEDFLLSDRKGILSSVCNHTGWGFCEGFRTSCRLAMPWGLGKSSREKTGNSLVFYQRGFGTFPVFSKKNLSL